MLTKEKVIRGKCKMITTQEVRPPTRLDSPIYKLKFSLENLAKTERYRLTHGRSALFCKLT